MSHFDKNICYWRIVSTGLDNNVINQGIMTAVAMHEYCYLLTLRHRHRLPPFSSRNTILWQVLYRLSNTWLAYYMMIYPFLLIVLFWFNSKSLIVSFQTFQSRRLQCNANHRFPCLSHYSFWGLFRHRFLAKILVNISTKKNKWHI